MTQDSASSQVEDELGAMRARLERGWRWLGSAPWYLWSAYLFVAVVVRAGVNGQGKYRGLGPCVAAFPKIGPGFRCEAVVTSALPAWLGVRTPRAWLTLHLSLTLVVLVVSALLIRFQSKHRAQDRATLAWVAVSSLPTVMLRSEVHYDVYALLAGSLLGLSAWWPVTALGGVLFGLVHPEQALCAGLAWLLLLAALDIGTRARRLAGGLGVLLGIALTKGYAWTHGAARADRVEHLWDTLGRSLHNAMKTGWAGVYACYGVGWVLVVAWLATAQVSRARRLGVVVALIALPGLLTLTTLDGTRVFIGTAWPAFAAFVCHLVAQADEEPGRFAVRTVTVSALVLALVLPAIVTTGSFFSRPDMHLWLALW